MRKIINGRKYDTETATVVGRWESCRDASDFRYVEEILYRKSTGKYFLLGRGNAMTEYATDLGGGSFSSGARIAPLGDDEARQFAELHLTCEEYEAEFGSVPE